MVLAGVLSDVGKENAQGEKVPDVSRFLTFKLAMRNIYNRYGCILIPDDSEHLNVVNTGAGFAVTSQGDSTEIIVGNSLQQVTWNVVTTNTAPINANDVEIFMSADGGYTWPYHIGTFPNNGSAAITFPNPDTTTTKARIKVKGANNVFFNVNKYNFTVTHSDGTDTAIAVYPSPTHNTLRVSSGNRGLLQGVIYNAVGQRAWSGTINGLRDIVVTAWARGVYIIKLRDIAGHKTVTKFVVD